jgi:CMP/dCMP kinase
MSAVIAVDGTAASGKGTLAKKLAAHFGFAHLDSGALYRLTALAVLETGGDPSREAVAAHGARSIDLTRANDPRLRSVEVGHASSVVAVFPSVRQAVLGLQRDFASHPPGGKPGAVIDGRDIGTVICPDAAAKLFVDARPEVRAHRRCMELNRMGLKADEALLFAELIARDKRDRERAVAPLRPAEDAVLIDNSDLSIEETFAAGLAAVREKIERALA